MTTVAWTSLSFFLLSVMLMILIVKVVRFASPKRRRFLFFAAVVYSSAGLLVLFFSLIRPGLPVFWLLIAQLMVLMVYFFTSLQIWLLTSEKGAKKDKNNCDVR